MTQKKHIFLYIIVQQNYLCGHKKTNQAKKKQKKNYNSQQSRRPCPFLLFVFINKRHIKACFSCEGTDTWKIDMSHKEELWAVEQINNFINS